MPNHTFNRVIVKKEIANRFISTDEEGKEFFDFNKIIPMPKELDIESGSLTDVSIGAYMFTKATLEESLSVIKYYGQELLGNFETDLKRIDKFMEYNPQFKPIDTLADYGQKYVHNIMKYGVPTWYQWCNSHWGTKWNAYNQGINKMTNKVILEFNTAWDCPRPIMRTLFEEYGESIEEWYYELEDDNEGEGETFHISNYKTI